MGDIDFWFSIGSTYSYLSVMRLDGVAAAAGVAFRWRPFNVRVLINIRDCILDRDLIGTWKSI